MFERFDKRSGVVVADAREEARLQGATKLGAEHLLLALSRGADSDLRTILDQGGLDHDSVLRALDAERERSLEAAGIASGSIGLLERPVPATGQPRWGASAKRALESAVSIARARGDRNLRPTHILLGVLRAEEGTVPRALAVIGVDQVALAQSAEASLGRPR
jgi:ATP-dependent Clp protease ATP-binding subunit ClpA